MRRCPAATFPGATAAHVSRALRGRYPEMPVELLNAPRSIGTARAQRAFSGNAGRMADLGADFGAGLTAREIDYLMAEEWAQSADDVLWRRTKCGLPMTQRAARGGRRVLRRCAARSEVTMPV